jgi:hypothetical protein
VITLSPQDYFELRHRATAYQLSQARLRICALEAEQSQREYEAVAVRVGLNPAQAYRFDDRSLTLMEILDGDSDSNG